MRRRAIAGLAAAMTLVAIAGCSSGGSDSSGDSAPEAAVDEGGQQDSDAGSGDGAAAPDVVEDSAGGEGSAGSGVITEAVQAVAGRDIIYTVDLSVQTDDVVAAARSAASVATAAGGFVADEQSDHDSSSTLTLKIPSDQHAAAVGELEELGEVASITRSTDDVTDEVVDTESRIASQRSSIARIRALLDAAGDLDQIITIESELATREADLDALLRRQEELSALTSMATVTVSFFTADDAPAEPPNRADDGFVSGLKDGWGVFTKAVAVTLTIVGAVLPFAALVALIGVPVLVVVRRRRAAATGLTQAGPPQAGPPQAGPQPEAPPAA